MVPRVAPRQVPPRLATPRDSVVPMLTLTPAPRAASMPDTASKPPRGLPGPIGRVLTTRPLARERPGLRDVFRAEHLLLRVAPTGESLMAAIEEHVADVVLVELDGVDHPCLSASMSSHRVVALLARRGAELGTIVIAQTALDFVEIEDLMRLGIGGLISPTLPTSALARHVWATLVRRRGPSAYVGARHPRRVAVDSSQARITAQVVARWTQADSVPIVSIETTAMSGR